MNSMAGMRMKSNQGGGQINTGGMNPMVDMVNRMLEKRGLSQGQFTEHVEQSAKKRLGEEEELIPGGFREAKLKQYNTGQEDLFNRLMEMFGPDNLLARLFQGDESAFEEMEAPALRQFSELQGNIANRFSGSGMGSRKSSGFYNTMNQASSNFAQDLASKRNDLRRQAVKDLMGMSEQLLNQRPYDKFLVEKYQKPQQPYEPTPNEQFLQFMGPIIGSAVQGAAHGGFSK